MMKSAHCLLKTFLCTQPKTLLLLMNSYYRMKLRIETIRFVLFMKLKVDWFVYQSIVKIGGIDMATWYCHIRVPGNSPMPIYGTPIISYFNELINSGAVLSRVYLLIATWIYSQSFTAIWKLLREIGNFRWAFPSLDGKAQRAAMDIKYPWDLPSLYFIFRSAGGPFRPFCLL